MKITFRNSVILALGAASLAACNGAQDGADIVAENDTDAPTEVAADIAKLSCEPLGDVAVWIETGEGGESAIVTHMQSEIDPEAEPARMALEPTGGSAGREGSRLSDEKGEYTVWMMDDGTATVKAGEVEVSCKA